MEAQAMESMRWVGVDVHAKESVAAVLDQATGEVSTHRIAGRPDEVLDWLARVTQPFRAVYEAGPTGYGLVRRAEERRLDVVVCAPGHILKNASDHIKVDKRDAARWARLLSAGELRLVRVPEPDEEQLRDLVRSREDLRVDLTRIRNRIGKFLLRREIYAPIARRDVGSPSSQMAARTPLRRPCVRARLRRCDACPRHPGS